MNYRTLNQVRLRNTNTNSDEKKSRIKDEYDFGLAASEGNKSQQLTTTQKVVEKTKEASYMSFALIGLAGVVYLVYVLGSNLLGTASPQAVYSRVCTLIKEDEHMAEILGGSIVCHGETVG